MLKNSFNWIAGVIFGLAIAISGITTSYAQSTSQSDSLEKSGRELQFFYHNPTFPKFIQITSAIVNLPETGGLLLIFSTMAINKHPDFAAQISKNFSNYSANEKQLLYTALIAAGDKNEAELIKNKYKYTEQINVPFTAETIKNLNINNDPANLDRIWGAFFATGDNIYLLKLLQYINSNDFLLMIGYELVNRSNMCEMMKNVDKSYCKKSQVDLVAAVKKQYPNNTEQMMAKALVIGSAIWSLESNRQQDPQINKKVNEIIQKNPNLDYVAKIKRALH